MHAYIYNKSIGLSVCLQIFLRMRIGRLILEQHDFRLHKNKHCNSVSCWNACK